MNTLILFEVNLTEWNEIKLMCIIVNTENLNSWNYTIKYHQD